MKQHGKSQFLWAALLLLFGALLLYFLNGLLGAVGWPNRYTALTDTVSGPVAVLLGWLALLNNQTGARPHAGRGAAALVLSLIASFAFFTLLQYIKGALASLENPLFNLILGVAAALLCMVGNTTLFYFSWAWACKKRPALCTARSAAVWAVLLVVCAALTVVYWHSPIVGAGFDLHAWRPYLYGAILLLPALAALTLAVQIQRATPKKPGAQS